LTEFDNLKILNKITKNCFFAFAKITQSVNKPEENELKNLTKTKNLKRQTQEEKNKFKEKFCDYH